MRRIAVMRFWKIYFWLLLLIYINSSVVRIRLVLGGAGDAGPSAYAWDIWFVVAMIFALIAVRSCATSRDILNQTTWRVMLVCYVVFDFLIPIADFLIGDRSLLSAGAPTLLITIGLYLVYFPQYIAVYILAMTRPFADTKIAREETIGSDSIDVG